jgi:hypothetical protein
VAEFGSNRDPTTVDKKMAVMHAVVQAPVQAFFFKIKKIAKWRLCMLVCSRPCRPFSGKTKSMS